MRPSYSSQLLETSWGLAGPRRAEPDPTSASWAGLGRLTPRRSHAPHEPSALPATAPALRPPQASLTPTPDPRLPWDTTFTPLLASLNPGHEAVAQGARGQRRGHKNTGSTSASQGERPQKRNLRGNLGTQPPDWEEKPCCLRSGVLCYGAQLTDTGLYGENQRGDHFYR